MDDDKSVVETPNGMPAAEETNGVKEYNEYEEEMDTSDEEVILMCIYIYIVLISNIF